MPNHRHKKQAPVTNGKRRGSGEENDDGKNHQAPAAHANGAGDGQQRHERENDQARGPQRDIENRDPQGEQGPGGMVKCCLPTGCEVDEMIIVHDPHDAVRVICNNEQCDQSGWMHKECFDMWEEVVLAYLRSCGRARSWSEKQRLQNLWTKKGYDLAFKACDCKCSRGHLRKDLDYIPKTSAKRRNKKKSTNDKPMPVLNTGKHEKAHHANGNGNSNGSPNGGGIMAVMINNINTNGIGVHPNVKRHMSGPLPPTHATPSNVQPQRVRHLSLTSTGSSPPNSLGSPATVTPPSTPCTPNVGGPKKSKFDFFADASQAAAGNIFKRRPDFMSFSILPRHKQNPYHIKMEDDGPHGNDDTRSFILSHLSSYKATNICCLLCKTRMPVFDRYPLIDGTFFLSPVMYDQASAYRVQMDGKTQYLQAVCMRCLEGGVILRCGACGRRWDGSTLLLGTMYSYDIFAATPCCQKRLSCKHCQIPIIICGLQFYSEYSHALPCPSCKIEDHHFVKPLQEVYVIQQPSICK